MATSLLDWIFDLMSDNNAKEAFNSNPQAAMASAGFSNVCGQDVADSRAFLFDNPSIKEVGGVERIDDDADAPDQIKYIVNNYTYEYPQVQGGDNVIDDDPIDVEGDDNTVNTAETETEANTTTTENSNNEDSTETETEVDTDISTETDTDIEADDTVNGNNSAGDDRISGSTLTDIGEGIESGDDNTQVLVLSDVLETGDVNLLSDLVSETLNGSPILNGSPFLNDVVEDSLNDSLKQILQDVL